MIRRAAAVVLVLTLYPALLYAQELVLTVTVPSADVYKGPSTITPVVGHVSRGTVLPVSRDLGSWAKVAWPDAPEGVAYVHVTMGRLSGSRVDTPAANPTPRPPSPAVSAPETVPPRPRTTVTERIAVRGQDDATSISHIFGVGGVVGTRSSFGGTARAWRTNHLGVQLGITRDTLTSGGGRVTSMQFEPGVVYALFDHVSDYVWVRPYVGSGMSLHHQTLTASASPGLGAESRNGVGFRVFGGSELTFAGVTRFALGVEVGYRHFPTPFAGFEPHHVGMSIAGHWYVK